jgi:beta-lactamase class A
MRLTLKGKAEIGNRETENRAARRAGQSRFEPCSQISLTPQTNLEQFAAMHWRLCTPKSLPLLLLLTLAQIGTAQTQPPEPPPIDPASPSARHFMDSVRLQALVDRAVKQTLQTYVAKDLETNQIALTLVDLTDPQKPGQASYRGGKQIYPASVIKLFYLVAAHHWMEDGQLKDTEELRRAMHDMSVDSLNEATGYIVDSLTGTTSGPELSAAEMDEWYFKRNAVNRYFASLGYTNINVNRKPWCEGPYGREMHSVQMHKPNHRNWLTTDATARLLKEIVNGQAVSSKRSIEMMELLKRDPFSESGNKDDQAYAYTGLALPAGSKLWSKAGWTSQTRHDAAYVELPNGVKFILVTFTVDHANEKEIIPGLAKIVVEGLSAER